jgi:hypothetical protein
MAFFAVFPRMNELGEPERQVFVAHNDIIRHAKITRREIPNGFNSQPDEPKRQRLGRASRHGEDSDLNSENLNNGRATRHGKHRVFTHVRANLVRIIVKYSGNLETVIAESLGAISLPQMPAPP